jgi:hypothetical protein
LAGFGVWGDMGVKAEDRRDEKAEINYKKLNTRIKLMRQNVASTQF